MRTQFKSLYDLFEAILDEKAAIAHFRSIRWANGPFCPYCGSTRVYDFSDGKTHKCGDCRQRFSIKVGTIFEDTKVPLRKWLAAIWLITSHKKGIASTQLARDIGVTQKTAWFMLHRLRYAARTRSFNRPLGGSAPVEADETLIGGKAKNRPLSERRSREGRRPGREGKTIVMALLERGGELRAGVIEDVTKGTLGAVVRHHVQEGAALYTDEAHGYAGLSRFYRHETVNHRDDEYVRGSVHTNSVEGFWALLKRQIYGIHHWVSAKHLDQYVSEATWRYMLREMADAARTTTLIAQSEGRLRYVDLIAKA